MSIRLNAVLRELNVGLQTAVDFLQKKNLGEVKADRNSKITDEQYNALKNEFSGDKDLRNQAEKLFPKKQKEKKQFNDNNKQQENAQNIVSTTNKPKFVGKIDLDNLGKKPVTKPSVAQDSQTTPQHHASAVSQESEKPAQQPVAQHRNPEYKKTEPVQQPVVKREEHQEAQPVKPADQPKPVQPQQAEPQKPKPTEQPKPVQQQPAAPVEQPKPVEKPQVEAPKEEPSNGNVPEDKLFTLKSENKMAPKVNVLGKIDLSTLNQSTRPKKKTKEERRKEREDKMRQGNNPNGNNTNNANGERRKRQRINKERVDINAAVSQNNGNRNNNGGNRNGNNNNNGGNRNGNNNPNGNNANNNNRKRNKKHNNQRPIEVNEEDVAKQVKETLARLTSKSQNKKGAKYRKEKRDAVQEKLNEEMKEEKAESKILKLTEFVTVSELATMMNAQVNQVIATCMNLGIMVSINQRLDAETINIVADEFGYKTEYVSAEVSEAVSEVEDDEADLEFRAPIVTVMGHVDHGKTSLLDYIRKANVIAGEAGGITQHIGAYNVKLEDGRHITFLDTPGHEAFTAMRARGAQVTDIAIIIIAADDSVMPTTREAIAHAQAANVPMVFAINKIDKPGANPDKIREDLANMNLLVEEWGGKYQCQEISAKKGIGVKELLEKVLLEAEMLDLKANPNRKATGSIIESSLDKGRGYVSTLLVSNGTLKIGDVVIAGTYFGRVKAMFNERNGRMDEAKPAEPAIILGLNGAPQAGDSFHVMDSEQEAREITNKRMQLQREQGLRTQTRLTLEEIGHRIALGEFKELNLIVKGDTDGSIEALSDSFIKLSTEKIQVNVIHKAVGQISESDVSLASASDAIIVGFQVRPSASARKIADQEGVEITTYSVIYDAIEDVKAAMEGMLDKIKKEVITGQVEVREVYKISKVGTVAGAFVTEGKVHRTDKARLVRDGIVVHTGEINALKRFKDDVKEVGVNFECGISLVNFNDIQAGDIIETFTEIEIKQKL
jgi:translation initiation factor IF-2